ncbi:MAG: hypothetical protein J6I45_00820 [Clostridia bacterium]|nr:hypothetical protein [Clostridia bacterium]
MELNIINPAAGKGASIKAAEASACQNHYFTKSVGDARVHVKELLSEGDEAILHVYGGDGTLNEVISGIMDANAADRVKVSIHPVGTGNDFHRNLIGITSPVKVDLIRCNDRYAVNMLNIGFDCRVVTRMADYKKLPLVKGTGAYILGVADVLMVNRMETMNIDILTADRRELHFDGEFLLTAIGNGAYCGGGFKAAAGADISDGILDMVLVHSMKRREFVSLIGVYKSGAHYSPEDMKIHDRYSHKLEYFRCRKISISGFDQICLDGEVEQMKSAEISVLPQVITFIPS